jgi:hypothetical protein
MRQPPDEPEYVWSDWTVETYLSVSARTAEEAAILVKEAVAEVNVALRRKDAIIQLKNEYGLPYPA